MFVRRALARCAVASVPRFLMGSRVRAYLKNLAANIPPWERDINLRKEPVDPWAFVRVHNEIRTVRQALNSISGVINKGVIAFHGCSDGTDDYVYEFCSKHPGFKAYQYPHDVIPAGDPRYGIDAVPYENSLAAYYNAVFGLIPNGSWFIKIDADMIYNPYLLKKSFYLPKNEREAVIYACLNLAYTKKGVQAINLRRPGDHWLMCKTPELKFVNVKKVIHGIASGVEVLVKGRKRLIAPELGCLHFPYEKSWRSDCSGVQLHDLSSFIDGLPDYEIDKSIWTPVIIKKAWELYDANDFDVSKIFDCRYR